MCINDMEDISPNNFTLVYDSENNILVENNKILLQKFDGTLYYVDADLVKQNFGLIEEEKTQEQIQDENCRSSSGWIREDILSLINLYKEFEEKFKSTTIKNEKIWKLISEKLGKHTPDQCKNKFKYLKQKYLAKKDNMKITGAKNVKFEYFEELDCIFAKNENVNPKYVASSIRGNDNVKLVETRNPVEEIETITEPPNKKKKTALQEDIEFLKNKQEAKEKREKERTESMERFTLAINRLSDAIGSFCNAITKFSDIVDKCYFK